MRMDLSDFVLVSDPKREDSEHSFEFQGRIISFENDGKLIVEDMDEEQFEVHESEILEVW